MCWSTKIQISPKKRIAEKDINVIKVGFSGNNGEFIPYYMSKYPYKKGEVTKKIELVFDKNIFLVFSISLGYHSYREEMVRVVQAPISKEIFIYSDNVLIGDFGEDLLEGYGKPCVGSFVIPKDTEYYENEYGEIVSSKIKFISII